MKNLPVRHENGETARYRLYKQRPARKLSFPAFDCFHHFQPFLPIFHMAMKGRGADKKSTGQARNFFGGLLFFFSICYSRHELMEVCLR